MPPGVRWLIPFLAFASTAGATTKVEPDPGPGDGAHRSELYRVECNDGKRWAETYTYATDNPAGSDVWSGGAVHFARFGADSPVDVRVTRLTGPIDDVAISPVAQHLAASVAGDQAVLRLAPLDKVWLSINGHDRSSLLLIFCDPPKPPVPAGARYYSAGAHFAGDNDAPTFAPASGQDVYLDAGAWVKGNFDMRHCRGVRVMGPGVLSGEGWDVTAKNNPSMIVGSRDASVREEGQALPAVNRYEGITIVRAPAYHFKNVAADLVSNVKLISPWRHSTDGFQILPQPDRPSVIENCFAFVGDDVFFPRENFTGDLEIRNCFVSSTNNSIFQICYWGNPLDHAHAMHAHDIDVVSHLRKNSAVFRASLTALPTTGARNMTFENIRIEGDLPESLLQIENREYFWPEQTTKPETKMGNTYDMVFRNVSLLGTQGKRSTLLGLDAANGHHHYVFDNVSIHGRALESSNYREFLDVNAFVWDVRCNGTPLPSQP